IILGIISNLQVNGQRSLNSGYNYPAPDNPFTYPTSTYPPIKTSSLQPQTGYNYPAPENPFTYPTIRTTSPRPAITSSYLPPIRPSTSTQQTGYNYPTPENPFTYPTSRRTTTTTTPRPIITSRYNYPAPENPLTYPLPDQSSCIGACRQNLSPENTYGYQLAYESTRNSDLITGFPLSLNVRDKSYEESYNTGSTNLHLNVAASNNEVFSEPGLRNNLPQEAASNQNAIRYNSNNFESVDNLQKSSNNNRQNYYVSGDIRRAIPGEPGRDYPALQSIPNTSFSCEGRASFLCPNGSVFNQELFTCDWWDNVDCSSSERYYDLNKEIGRPNPFSQNEELTPSYHNRNTDFPSSSKLNVQKVEDTAEQQDQPIGSNSIIVTELLPPY
ncbi:hypothetical protein C0J52_19001, partial [Blattella germanica]